MVLPLPVLINEPDHCVSVAEWIVPFPGDGDELIDLEELPEPVSQFSPADVTILLVDLFREDYSATGPHDVAGVQDDRRPATTAEASKCLCHAITRLQLGCFAEVIGIVTELDEFPRADLDWAIVPSPDVPDVFKNSDFHSVRREDPKKAGVQFLMPDPEHAG